MDFFCIHLFLQGNSNNYQKMLQTFSSYQPVHYHCPNKPMNNSHVSKNKVYTGLLPLWGEKKPSTFKYVFLSDISAGIICQSKSFRNRSFTYKHDTGSIRLPIPLQTIDDMARVCMQLPSSTECDRSSYWWQPIFFQEELQWTHFLLVAVISLIYWSTT